MVWEHQTGGSDTANSGGFRGGAYIAPPSAPTVVGAGTGGTVAANTYYLVSTYTDGLGETVISGQTSVTLTGATSKFTVTSPPAITGAVTWSSYSGTTTAGPYFPISTGMTIGVDLVRTTTPPTTGTQPRGVDRSLSTTRQVVVDNSTITATTAGANSNVITFSGYTATGADVGNTFIPTAGTNINLNTPYEITAITPTTWTVQGATNLTTAGGAGSAIVGGMGGCFASAGRAYAFAITGNSVYGKRGTYSTANGTANTAGNKIAIAIDAPYIGYDTNRHPGNTDIGPTFDAAAASMTVFSVNQNFAVVHNVNVTNSGVNASVVGFTQAGGGSCHFSRISVTGCATGINSASGTSATSWHDCTTSGGGGFGGSGAGSFYRCTALSFTGAAGFAHSSGSHYVDCIAANGSSQGGFSLNGGSTCENCDAYGNGLYGFNIASTNTYYRLTFIDCIAYGNTTTGFKSTTNSFQAALYNCAAGGNTVADFDAGIAAWQKVNCATLSGDPHVDAAGGNYGLNNTPGAGALCRQLGIPGAFAGLPSTTGYRSIGAVEPQASGGGVPHLAGRGGGLAG